MKIAVTNSDKNSVSLHKHSAKVCFEGPTLHWPGGATPFSLMAALGGFFPLLMWLSAAGTTIQHCHLLTVIFHCSTDKALPKKTPPKSRNQPFIFKDLMNNHICFKKAKRGTSQRGYFFRGPDFIYSFVIMLWEHILHSVHRNISEDTWSLRSPICQQKKKF